MLDFVERYFIEPMITGEGYNIFNTLVYGALFVAGIYLANQFFARQKIGINKKWFWSMILIAPIGGITRAIEDWIIRNYGILPTHFIFSTPGIYILLAALVIGISWFHKDTESFARTSFIFFKTLLGILGGVFLILVFLSGLHNLNELVIAAVLTAVFAEFSFAILGYLGLKSKENRLLVWSHALDGFVSAVSISMIPAYYEQHVVTGFVMSMHPFAYPVLKLLLAGVAIWLIDTQVEEENWKWLSKFAIIILGLGPGTRDFLRILIGV